MTHFYTRDGDDGYTGLLGEGRMAKYHPRAEAIGAIDEASAVVGLARAMSKSEISQAVLLTVQRDLYTLMAETAATIEAAGRFRAIDAQRVAWLEAETDRIGETIELPSEFIVPGDSMPGASMAMARTAVRRAERRVALLVHQGELENQEILRYLNRLSSLCFLLELVENQASGTGDPTLAKLDQ